MELFRQIKWFFFLNLVYVCIANTVSIRDVHLVSTFIIKIYFFN